jgi:hypothetical protein
VLIDDGIALDDGAVDRDDLPCIHDQDIPDLKIFERRFQLHPLAQHVDHLARGHHEQVGEVFVRLPLGLGDIIEGEEHNPERKGDGENMSGKDGPRQDDRLEDDAGETSPAGQIVVGEQEGRPQQVEHAGNTDEGQRRIENPSGDRQSQGCRGNRVVLIARVPIGAAVG